MARKTQTKTIDGVRFEVTQLLGPESRRLFVRIAQQFGPGLVELLSSKGEEARLQAATVRLLTSLTEADIDLASEEFGKTTRFSTDGRNWPYLDRDARETLFEGDRLLLHFQWLAFALEVQYGSFAGGLGKMLGALAPEAPVKSASEDSKSA